MIIIFFISSSFCAPVAHHFLSHGHKGVHLLSLGLGFGLGLYLSLRLGLTLYSCLLRRFLAGFCLDDTLRGWCSSLRNHISIKSFRCASKIGESLGFLDILVLGLNCEVRNWVKLMRLLAFHFLNMLLCVLDI